LIYEREWWQGEQGSGGKVERDVGGDVGCGSWELGSCGAGALGI